ncbi:MAG: SapC family protein [Hellea sp.]|nr:SapC family protein [Hellea sp.]
MAKAPKENDVSVTGNVMFYNNPKPLNKDAHGKSGVKPVDKPFEFMAKNHFVPLTAQEFGAAAASYPVVFAGDERNPIAIMGIRTGENLFVSEGQFAQDYYLPAFARRYPFVLANDPDNQRFVVCVDEEAECVTNKKPEKKFFDGDQASAFTQEAFQFLQNFERDRQSTQNMIARFKELDLFEMKDMHFQGQNPDGSPSERQKIAEYFAITEERLKALPIETIKELNDNGMLAVAHAHMISLGNWQRLVNMTLRRAAEEAAS